MASAAFGALAAGLGAGVAAAMQRKMYSDALNRASGGTGTDGQTDKGGGGSDDDFLTRAWHGIQSLFGSGPSSSGASTITAGGAVPGQPAGMITPATYGTQQFGPPAPTAAVHPAVRQAAASGGTVFAFPQLPPPQAAPSTTFGRTTGPYGVLSGGWGQANVPLGQGANYPNLNLGTLPMPTAGPGAHPAGSSSWDLNAALPYGGVGTARSRAIGNPAGQPGFGSGWAGTFAPSTGYNAQATPYPGTLGYGY